jgi:hypothetical protein
MNRVLAESVGITKMLRHPERSRPSGEAKDLPCNGTARGATNRDLAEEIAL